MTYLECYKLLVEVAKEAPRFKAAVHQAVIVLFNEVIPQKVAFLPPGDIVFLFPFSYTIISAAGCESSHTGGMVVPRWTNKGIQLHFNTLLELYNEKPRHSNTWASIVADTLSYCYDN